MTFTAVADCPKCGSLDVHWLDTPKGEPPSRAEVWAYGERVRAHVANPGEQIVEFGGRVLRQIGGVPHPGPPPVDESGFEVMRLCTSCSHRWGQE